MSAYAGTERVALDVRARFGRSGLGEDHDHLPSQVIAGKGVNSSSSAATISTAVRWMTTARAIRYKNGGYGGLPSAGQANLSSHFSCAICAGLIRSSGNHARYAAIPRSRAMAFVESEHIAPRCQLDHSLDGDPRDVHDHEADEVHVCDHETGRQPRSGEGLQLERRREQSHSRNRRADRARWISPPAPICSRRLEATGPPRWRPRAGTAENSSRVVSERPGA